MESVEHWGVWRQDGGVGGYRPGLTARLMRTSHDWD